MPAQMGFGGPPDDDHNALCGEAGFFRSYFSAALLCSLAAGILAMGGGHGMWPFFVGPVLCLIPGIVEMSGAKMALGAVVGFLLPAFVGSRVGISLAVNGREPMPLTVLQLRFVEIITPHYDRLPLGAGGRGAIALCAYLLCVDVVILALRQRCRPRRRTVLSVAASYLPVLLLYRLSWFATVQGPFFLPPSHGIWRELAALGVYGLAYPAKYLLMFYLLDPRGYWGARPPHVAGGRGA